jgi:hypothetical protein
VLANRILVAAAFARRKVLDDGLSVHHRSRNR